MHNTDSAERYLADVYASPLPAPELQLQWARDIDRAQCDFNRAVACNPAAARCVLRLCRRLPHACVAAHVLARWAPDAARDAARPEDMPALIESAMAGLERVLRSAADCADARQACLLPLRLRTEFMAEIVAALRDAAAVHAEVPDTLAAVVARVRAATDRLVRANQRLVATLARQYRYGPLSFMDLVQEGNLGLLRAIERFDPDHGTRVSTYSMWWVRRAMVYAIARQGRDVRPSVAQYWAAREVTRTLDRLEREHGRRATYREAANRLGTTVAEVQRHLGALAPPLALDAPVAAAADVTRAERLACQPELGPEHAVLAGDIRRAVGELLDQLPERHARILRLRFGIGVREDCTLEQIAQQQGVTRERIRQLEAQALNALRRLDSAWLLRSCLG
jgi:RNA polymerase sigma factor (sigma-70 family)